MIIKIKEQQLDGFLKLSCLVSYHELISYEELISEDFIVNNLAVIKLCIKDKNVLECHVLAQAISSDTVKIKVLCQDFYEPFYSEWICNNSWKLISKRTACDVSLDDVYTCVFNIIISASKKEESFLMKLFNDVDFTDFSLSTGDGSVPVHRAHLAAASDVFQAMLTKEWKETTEGRIQLEGISLQTLQHFKEFMYLRRLPDEGIKPLLLFASYYLVDDLKAECISKLVLNSKPSDLRGLLQFATKKQIFELIRAIMFVNPVITVEDEQKE